MPSETSDIAPRGEGAIGGKTSMSQLNQFLENTAALAPVLTHAEYGVCAYVGQHEGLQPGTNVA
jgi:hypothetical protein